MKLLYGMLTPEQVLLLTGLLVLLWMLHAYHGSRKRLRTALLTGIGSGLAALYLANRFGAGIGVTLPVNLFTLTAACIGGAPAVILLLVIALAAF